nr:hypothetical protein [Tanacetum cinerariifolium]
MLHEHWKNPLAKIFDIKKQKEPEKPKEIVYSKSKIVQIIKTYWELGHGHKFITKIVARRANGSIGSIIESDYKNLNKNDIEDMYLLIVCGDVDDYAETELLWSLSVFIRSIVIWKRVHDFQLGNLTGSAAMTYWFVFLIHDGSRETSNTITDDDHGNGARQIAVLF